uniref:Peptide deformylase n=1 Tax=Opuntia streptacantha TaxID=393608 RepID=A0A7C8YKY4_OPUST
MEAIPRFSTYVLSLSSSKPNSKFLITPLLHFHSSYAPTSKPGPVCPNSLKFPHFLLPSKNHSSSTVAARVGWFLFLGDKKQNMPDVVKAGDPVLHEPAREVDPNEIGSERIQKIIDDMVKVMRKAPGVGLAAPQIGIPLKIIVLEDTEEYISYAAKQDVKAQDRRPFDLLI